MKEKLEFWFYQLFTTKIGWLMITMVLGVIFGILANMQELYTKISAKNAKNRFLKFTRFM